MKPMLLWPLAKSAIPVNLEQAPDFFTIIDTSVLADLPRLREVGRDTLVLDPFPTYGEHYREFLEHVRASRCRYYVGGLEPCQQVVRALRDPSLSRASTEELLLALGYLSSKT